MNVEIQSDARVCPFVADEPAEPPVRVVEYVRHAAPECVERDAPPSWSGRPWPVSPHARLPTWLARVLLAWALLALASLVGPCRPLSPSPALAAEASP